MTAPDTTRSALLLAAAIGAAIGVFALVGMLRDLPLRIDNGDRAHLAIQSLDEARRPFLEIQDATSALMNEGYREWIVADFQRGVERGWGRIADFKTAAAYNPEVLRRVDSLATAFENWLDDELTLFELAKREGPGSTEALHVHEGIASKGFSVTMSLLGDAEGAIHDDIDRGADAVAELAVGGGALITGLAVAAFFLMWSRNRALGTMLAERNRATEEIHRLNEGLERRVEERTAELRGAQAELLRAERLATLGQLTGTVAHELRNPLTAILSSLGVIELKCQSAGVDMERSLDRINRAVKRCDSIITELLDFARTRGLQPEPTDLDAWLGELLDEQQQPEGITVTRDWGLDNAVISIDREEVRRAVINVIDNACQAMVNGDGATVRGKLAVATRRNGERIEIEVDDTGPGIPEDIMQKIFEPLYSTKPLGIGLGLPIVQQIFEHHGGGFEINSRQGHGTQAILWFPVDPAPQQGVRE